MSCLLQDAPSGKYPKITGRVGASLRNLPTKVDERDRKVPPHQNA
jgi:hypothetical protein